MNKYRVTYALPLTPGQVPGTLRNTEMEINKQQADEIRAELARVLREGRPLVHGRDWEYIPLDRKTTVIEADSFSISREGIAYFYVKSDNGKISLDPIAAINRVITILKLDPDEKGGSGSDPASFLASLIKIQRDESVAQETRAEAQQLIERIKDKARKLTADEVRKHKKTLVVRYNHVNGGVAKYVMTADFDDPKPEIHIDLRPWTKAVED